VNIAFALPEIRLLASHGDAKKDCKPMRKVNAKELIDLGAGKPTRHAV